MVSNSPINETYPFRVPLSFSASCPNGRKSRAAQRLWAGPGCPFLFLDRGGGGGSLGFRRGGGGSVRGQKPSLGAFILGACS